MVEIVNIVAVGYLGREYDLHALSEDLDLFCVKYEPERFPGLKLRLKSDGPLMCLFSSGSYTITGVRIKSELESFFADIISAITELGVNTENMTSPEIRNLVCKGDLEREVDLLTLSVGLGINKTEYEPEQSPFLYYWPEAVDCLITIPSNGEVVITGVRKKKEAEEAFESLHNKVESLLPQR